MSWIASAVGAAARMLGQAAVDKAGAGASAANFQANQAARVAQRTPTPGNQNAAARAAHAAHLADQHAVHASNAANRNDAIMGQLMNATGGLSGMANLFAHSITVTVKGGPKASLRRCWFLCVAALFGRRRRGVDNVWSDTLNAQWDITGKTVTATLAYCTSSITEPYTNFVDTESPVAMLQRGPDQVTIGAGWPTSYWTFGQNVAFAGFGLNKGLADARVAGGQLSKFLDSLVPLPGELNDPANANKLGLPPTSVIPLPPGKLESITINASQLTSGWVIEKPLVDALTPRPIAIVQPFTIDGRTDALAEMPIKTTDGLELLPYRAHRPQAVGDSWRYVRRGGSVGVLPVLPDDGRVITTGEKLDPRVQSPRPPVDGLMRGHILTMVAAQLATPGVQVAVPPNPVKNVATLAAEGAFVRPPGVVFASPLPSDRYRYQPAAIVANLVNVIVNTVMPEYGHTVPPASLNLR